MWAKKIRDLFSRKKKDEIRSRAEFLSSLMSKGSAPKNIVPPEDLSPLIQFGEPVSVTKSGGHAVVLNHKKSCYTTFDKIPKEVDLNYYYSNYYSRGEKSNESYYTIEDDYGVKSQMRADRHEYRLKRHVAKTSNPVFLDLGCAFGGAVSALRSRGHVAFGIDVSEYAISTGRKHGNNHIFVDDSKELSEASLPLADVTTCFHTLEHIPDPIAYLKKTKSRMKEGGVILFHVPNGAYAGAWLSGFKSWEWFNFPDHLYFYTPYSIVNLAKLAGFELVEFASRNPIRLAEKIIKEAQIECEIEALNAALQEACLGAELQFVLRKPRSAKTLADNSRWDDLVEGLAHMEQNLKKDPKKCLKDIVNKIN